MRAARLRILPTLASLVWASPLLAQEPNATVDVSWSAPAQCPGISELLARIEGFLGQPLHTGRQQVLAVSGVVHAKGTGYAASLTLTSPDGSHERYLEHHDCSRLVEGAALATALAIDPDRVQAQTQQHEANEPASIATPNSSAPPPPVNEPPVMAPPAAAPFDSPPPARRTERAAPARPRFMAALVGLAGAGTLPDFGTGAGLQLAMDWTWLRAAAVGRYWLPRSTPVGGDPRASLNLQLTTVGLRGCALPWRTQITLAACAGFEVGDLAGTGEALALPRTRHDRWSGVSFGAELTYGGGALAPVLGLEGTLATETPRFGVLRDGAELEVFRPSWWAAQGYLGLAARLP